MECQLIRPERHTEYWREQTVMSLPEQGQISNFQVKGKRLPGNFKTQGNDFISHVAVGWCCVQVGASSLRLLPGIKWRALQIIS
jgi:hypothetical protein